MICPDCGQEISKPRNHSTRFTASYYCMQCRHEHIVWEDIKEGDYVIQSKDWRFYCDKENNRSRIRRLYMDIESDTSICYRWANVLELPVIPDNLSVDTFDQKLKMYLLFS